MTNAAWIISRYVFPHAESIPVLMEHISEHTIDELANRPIQTSPDRFLNRLAGGIPTHGSSDDRF